MITMNSKYGSRTYARSTKTDRSNVKFETVLSESKPSTAKVSMTAVHRWGNTSYTSIRSTGSSVNGDTAVSNTSAKAPDVVIPATKRQRVESPKKETVKSTDPFDFETPANVLRKEDPSVSTSSPDKSVVARVPPKKNKFFKSRNLFDSLKNGPTYNKDKLRFCESGNDAEIVIIVKEDPKVIESNPEVKEEAPNISSYSRSESPVLPTPFEKISISVEVDVSVEPAPPSNDSAKSSTCINTDTSRDEIVDTNTRSTGNKSDQNSAVENASMEMEVIDDGPTELVNVLPVEPFVPQPEEPVVVKPEPKARPAKKFFTNRQKKLTDSPSKSPNKALFKMNLWDHDDEIAENKIEHSSQPTTLSDDFSADVTDVNVPSLRKHKSEPTRPGREAITSVHCERGQKPLYTVVRNVKQAHQCHESGETQEFNDDIDYLIGGLESHNSTGTRCLSALSLATKCMIPSFRMHLRAHGTIPKLFSALCDAASDPNVAFCATTLMFVLSQDRLNMDLDSSMLELMLQLLETSHVDMSRSGMSNKELQKNKDKVRGVCEQMQLKSHAKHLNLDFITTGELAMETLLTLTSKRAGEWFKEEIRELGGLDHIVKTVEICSSVFEGNIESLVLNTSLLEKLGKISRCFRVLENVTYQNVDNQNHLIIINDSSLIKSLIKLLNICTKLFPLNNVSHIEDISLHPKHPGVVLFNCLQSTLRVLVNLTNNNAATSNTIGHVPGVLHFGLDCVLKLPAYVPIDKKFDLCVLSLGVLINLMELSEDNRKLIMETDIVISVFDGDVLRAPAMEALVQLFTEKFEDARKSEEQTDKLLVDTEKQYEANVVQKEEVQPASQQSNATNDDIEETLMKALKKAGKHMEHSIVGAYTALLIGFIIQNNQDYTDQVREYLPEGDYTLMAKLLRTLYNFMVLTVAPGTTGVTTVQNILEVLDAS